MQRIALLVLVALALSAHMAAPLPAQAATVCLYPGMDPTWTSDTPQGTLIYSLSTDEYGRPIVTIQAPDGTVTTETIGPCTPGSAYAPGIYLVSPPLFQAVPLPAPGHRGHHHHGDHFQN